MWFAFIVISITLMAVVALFLYIVSDSRKSGVPLETEVWTFFNYYPQHDAMDCVGAMTTPTIEDYIHGNVEVTIEQTIKNGEVIKQDTVHRKL